MGIYLNSRAAYTLYKSETEKPYFVDKTSIREELFPLVRTGNNHICITRFSITFHCGCGRLW